MKLLNTVLIVMACCVNITVQYNYRLPKDVNPEHYELHIVTDLDNGQPNFHGRVRIKARIILSTDRIIMNCKSLTIKKDDVHVTKDNKNADEIFVSDVEIDSYFNFLIIKFNETLQAGQVFFIQIPFSAQLTNETNGYFRRSYIDKKTGHSSSFAVTRFHASFARKAFPCFDEPNFKSVFSINLGHREKLKSLSNMPSVKILPMKNKKGWVWNKFMDTQQIPVHILNFIVFDLECVCGKLRRNISFCLWARKDNLKKFKTAKELSPEIFGYVEDYFGVNYPLTKYDMIALPKLDFDCVEGLGISILSEELILKEGDLAIDVSVIVAREFISQWFGGLITFKWWSDLWVHEGFLGYFSNVVAANVSKLYVTKRPYIQKLTFFEQLSSGMKHDNIITMNPLVELVESDNITDISKANSLVESSYNRG
ncbi:aminopeptidase Q-like [Lycorma delicatula]|uniref:aminopeptidase Q-like n=1 Tax=Lycorma delicatula TaxID=130591 RepID=UPI003F5176DD